MREDALRVNSCGCSSRLNRPSAPSKRKQQASGPSTLPRCAVHRIASEVERARRCLEERIHAQKTKLTPPSPISLRRSASAMVVVVEIGGGNVDVERESPEEAQKSRSVFDRV